MRIKFSSEYENYFVTDETGTYLDSINNYSIIIDGKDFWIRPRLGTHSYETKRTIIYENGKTEEWEQGDIGTSKNLVNARMELIEYIIIEKDKEKSKIKIEAKEMLDNKSFGNFENNLETE